MLMTLVFCEAEQEQICYLRLILVIFEACSGLKVNWRKSDIFPVKEEQQIQSLADILKYRIEELPTIYLGMLLGANHNAVNIWDGIIEKTEKRLVLRKSQYLSLGGRVVLINAVQDSLPTYVMSLFPIPGEVVKILDKLRMDFLLQGSKIEKSFNLVNGAQFSKARVLEVE
uniref:Putative ovule protein n=1 Tax=Solanum chacoense TaxID=4108 RepID=A0A0V0IBM1_SOLCH